MRVATMLLLWFRGPPAVEDTRLQRIGMIREHRLGMISPAKPVFSVPRPRSRSA
jgi:hypothetical protein